MKSKSYASLKRKMDKVFSEWIRRRWIGAYGRAMCVSCGMVAFWKSMHCGHFVSRVRLATRWDEENCAVQCPRCNIFLAGNAVGYARWLENRYGPSIFAALDERSKQPTKFSRSDLQSMIDKYVAKIKELPRV